MRLISKALAMAVVLLCSSVALGQGTWEEVVRYPSPNLPEIKGYKNDFLKSPAPGSKPISSYDIGGWATYKGELQGNALPDTDYTVKAELTVTGPNSYSWSDTDQITMRVGQQGPTWVTVEFDVEDPDVGVYECEVVLTVGWGSNTKSATDEWSFEVVNPE